MRIFGYKLDWFDLIVTPLAYLISAATYSWWIDNWLKGMSIGLLLFITGWMVMEWFILGDENQSSPTGQKPEVVGAATVKSDEIASTETVISAVHSSAVTAAEDGLNVRATSHVVAAASVGIPGGLRPC
jgi:hypothetical protein